MPRLKLAPGTESQRHDARAELVQLEKEEHAPETEEYGISSTIFRCNTMPFHPGRLNDILTGFGTYGSALESSKEMVGSATARRNTSSGSSSSASLRSVSFFLEAFCDDSPCGDGRDGHGASFVADLGDGHMVRFLVSDFGISWVESRNGRELVKLEGAEAIQELQRMSNLLHQGNGSRAGSSPMTTAEPL